MSDSLVLVLSRSGKIKFVDPDAVPHTDDLPPILKIAVAVINAGYEGVAVDELRRANGTNIHHLDVNLATPEGQILQSLASLVHSGGRWPDAKFVLTVIERAYEILEGRRETD